MPSTQRDLTPRDRLAVALDFPNEHEAMKLVDRLGNTCQWYKVGMELYYAAGNSIVQQLRDRGFNVFLDLKLHDIPNTVAGAVRSVTSAGASLLTVHAGGGAAMMAAAAEAAAVPDAPAVQVLRLAKLARGAGIDGMVCSPEEVGILRQEIGSDAMLVIPGIR